MDFVIVGAGLAGLCCARVLLQKGISFLILEAAKGVGGRVWTDRVEGFLLDRGFQVLQTAYPEAPENHPPTKALEAYGDHICSFC
jgi:phytoene dehydrogenase-like protein